MSAHTPGPWIADRRQSGSSNDIEIIAPATNGCCVAHIQADDKIGDQERADAALIAAAPDLLVALRDAVSMLDAMRDYAGIEKFRQLAFPPTMGCMRIAIAKAEGRS